MKKIIVKKKVVPVTVPEVHAHHISTMNMEDGEEYVGIGCNTVLKLKKIIPYEGPDTGLRALRSTIVECTIIASSMGGGQEVATLWGTSSVLTDCPDLVERIKKEQAGINSAIASNARITKTVKKDLDGNVVVAKPRGDISPVTGYGAGTQGHHIGLIMIEGKCAPSRRGIILPKIVAYLMKDHGFEEKKAKGLAASWYSTLWIRKPTFYQKEWK